MPEPLKPVKASVWKTLLPLVIVLALVPALGMMQGRIDDQLEVATGEELLYFPNDKLLRHFTGGLDNVVADFLWYRTVQYTGQEFSTRNSKFTWLEHMIDVTTSISPQYEDPYRYGGVLLTALDTEGTGRADNAMDVLKRGFENVPHSWTIPYEMHTIYLMNRRNEPNANLLASRYAVLVAERHTGSFKQKYFELSQKLLEQDNNHEYAVEFFRERVENETDPVLRALAEDQLRVAVIELNIDVLNAAVLSYRDVNGALPENLEVLVRDGFISALPDDPEQGSYFIDTRIEQVRNTTIAQERAQRLARRLTVNAQKRFDETGAYPANLDEVFEIMGREPYNYPIPGGYWEYDASTCVARVPGPQ